MSDRDLYVRHLEALDRWLADTIERAGRRGLSLDGIVLHAGRSRTYHADDQEIPFRSVPHFRRFVPLEGPEHLVVARPGRKLLVYRVVPKDFWYEAAPLAPDYWAGEVDLREVDTFADAAAAVKGTGTFAYVGNAPEAAEELGIPAELVEPEAVMAPLDWYRAFKTEWEVSRIEVAAKKVAEGHRVARKAFESGASEREIHWAFLEASGQLERECPFETIVALDEKTATLHYQNKRGREAAPGKVFMLDAGAAFEGYASDVTRTWALESADELFRTLLEALDALERDLVTMVTPSRPYPEIHAEAHRRIALLLAETGIVKGSAEEALERGVTRTFLPHGVGHHLGLQVHDVGGRQAGPDGGTVDPPPEHPFLRTTRTLEVGHVVTIEPGIYFIPLLLDQLEASPEGKLVDWKLVRRLVPFGGIRIEDDVVCTDEGPRDLTRPLIQGPRGI